MVVVISVQIFFSVSSHSIPFIKVKISSYIIWEPLSSAWGLQLEAWGFAPYYIINSGCTKSEALAYDLGAQALHLVKVQDPINCSFI